ncbi:class I SAM-dependent methyltransferase [Candidatus Woesearchaeota archaeon]|nr:class I SAM-dependent methyltransferase [Candidatus Woesearchaeota archaeon]
MVKLELLLKNMEEVDWDKIKITIPINHSYIRNYPNTAKKFIEEAGFNLEGSVLDVACGPASLGCLHNNVVGFDSVEEYIKILRKKSIRGIVGDIRDIPFDRKSFDQVVCVNPPITRVYEKREKVLSETFEGSYHVVAIKNPKSYAEHLVRSLLQIARKKVLIISLPITENLRPVKYDCKIEKEGKHSIIYNAE